MRAAGPGLPRGGAGWRQGCSFRGRRWRRRGRILRWSLRCNLLGGRWRCRRRGAGSIRLAHGSLIAGGWPLEHRRWLRRRRLLNRCRGLFGRRRFGTDHRRRLRRRRRFIGWRRRRDESLRGRLIARLADGLALLGDLLYRRHLGWFFRRRQFACRRVEDIDRVALDLAGLACIRRERDVVGGDLLLRLLLDEVDVDDVVDHHVVDDGDVADRLRLIDDIGDLVVVANDDSGEVRRLEIASGNRLPIIVRDIAEGDVDADPEEFFGSGGSGAQAR